ncbi:putative emp24 gp25L p24 family GOLD [Trypanosoma vivax]|uniref:GOLD domain-containing protein n=1 Tax=Trypanosoma vivax (strain Y486) TaxID=1055687 RepID=G0UBA1_TRYVY|nr:hypothetical protein TRVL_03183 [Trypanosoma vivax]KAH8606242.1 putative emp24 gp25L p24 family GOLD [Trypanosoma vivax]CCC53088.1 conserved hypothetical protein [Trypanosoma vivax Y486]
MWKGCFSSAWLSSIAVAIALLWLPACHAFRFTATPGRKCYTEQLPGQGQYYLHYKMARSFTPFVSVTVTSSSGRSLLEHDVAKSSAREIFSVEKQDTIAVCFKVSKKAPHSSASMNITLEVLDAEDAELTMQKKRSYSMSTPVALGVGKKSGAMQQMEYIMEITTHIRFDYLSLIAVDEDMRYSLKEMNAIAWNYVYVFAGMAMLICLVSYLRLRHFFKTRKYI